MRIIKDNKPIKYLYHYTKRENVDSIISSKEIRSSDDYVFFTDSLDKSVSLFERDMMSCKYYYDLNCQLKRRIPAHKEDYRIIKIAYKNDGEFYRFIIPNNTDKDNVYNVSRIHKGTLYFESAEVLEFPKEYIRPLSTFKYNMFSKFASLAFLLTPLSVNADSWLAEGNYSMDWEEITTGDSTYNKRYYIKTPEELAGVSYGANHGEEYENVLFIISPSSAGKIDLSSRDWVPLPSSFKGVIRADWGNSTSCGIHRVYLNLAKENGIYFRENNICDYEYLNEIGWTFDKTTGSCSHFVTYKHQVLTDITGEGTVEVQKDYYLKNEYVYFNVTPGEHSSVGEIIVKDTSNNTYSIRDTSNGKRFTMGDKHVTISATFIKEKKNVNVTYDEHILNNDDSFEIDYGDSFSLDLELDDGWYAYSYTLNNVTYPITDNKIEFDSIVDNMNISIVAYPIFYRITSGDNNNLVQGKGEDIVITTDGNVELIDNVQLCLDDDCTILNDNQYVLDNYDVRVLGSVFSELDVGEYGIVVFFKNGIAIEANVNIIKSDDIIPEEPKDEPKEEDKPVVNPNTRVFVSMISIILVVVSFIWFRNNYKKIKRRTL